MKTRHPIAYVLNVVAEDRPGIVATVSRTVVDSKGNIDACSQTVLAEYFTLIMVISFPEKIDPDALCREIRDTDIGPDGPGLQAQIRPYQGSTLPTPLPGAGNFVLTAFGKDREGVTLQFSTFLADKGINIRDLYGRHDQGQFIVIGQIQVPQHLDIQMLQTELEHMAEEIGYTVKLQHENVFVATSQLRPPHAGRGDKE